MVSSRYFHHAPPPSSAAKRFFDQRIVPLAIDGAACLDIGIVRAQQQIERNPMVGLGIAAVAGALLLAVLRPRATAGLRPNAIAARRPNAMIALRPRQKR